jgi:hypothetical protein
MKTQKISQIKVSLNKGEIVTAKVLKQPFYLFGRYWALVTYIYNENKPYCIVEMKTGRVGVANWEFHYNSSQKAMLEIGINKITDIYKRIGETEFNNVINQQPIINEIA